MSVGASFRSLLVFLALIAASAAYAQGGTGTHPRGPPRQCDSFDRCLQRCNAKGGTGGTDIGCARVCHERNCINDPDNAGADGGTAIKRGDSGPPSGASCEQAFDKCKASCGSKSGNP